jgi:hypothetical protein
MDFKKERDNMIAQRDNAFAVYQQTIGAIALLDHLISEEESPKKDSLTVDEFKEIIGAKEVELPE